MEMNEETKKAIESLIDDLKPIVQEIEKSPELTQYHYGDYMTLLSKYPEKAKTVAFLLLKAGANSEGIRWALRLSTGDNY